MLYAKNHQIIHIIYKVNKKNVIHIVNNYINLNHHKCFKVLMMNMNVLVHVEKILFIVVFNL